MLFVLGLLTLSTLANAGGDHTKGGGHIKGGDHIKSAADTFQQEIAQDEIVPSAFSFNTKTGPEYGTKISRDEVGDSEGRVKGVYTLSSPRGASRVVQYQADDTGFHTSIKTSEPNIKTHSPTNVHIEAVSKKGANPVGQGTQELIQKLSRKTQHTVGLHHASVVPVEQDPIIIPDGDHSKGIKTMGLPGSLSGKTRFAVRDSILKEPIARPVVSKPIIAVKTTSPVLEQTVQQANIKTAPSDFGISTIQQSVKTVPSFAAPPTEQQNVKTIVKLSPAAQVKGRDGKQGVRVIKQRTSTKTINPVIKGSGDILPDTLKIRGSVNTEQRPATTSGERKTESRFRVSSTSGRLNLRAGSQLFGDDIIALNRGLIQKQSEAGIQQTFGGVIQSDGNFEGISISSEEVADLSKGLSNKFQIGEPQKPGQILTPNVPKRRDRITEKPRTVGSSVYPGSRTSSRRVTGPTRAKVIPGPTRTSGQAIYSNQGENIRFILGNAPDSPGAVRPGPQAVSVPKPRIQTEVRPQIQLSEDIIAINRGLIQKQTEGGIQQTFGGIIKTDGDLRGISISSDELGDISKRIGYDSSKIPKPEVQQKKPGQILPFTPNVSRQGVRIAEKSRTIGSTAYSRARTPSGRAPVATRTRVIPGQIRTSGQITSSYQGENVQFVLGNAESPRGAVRPIPQSVSAPKPKIPSQIKPQIQLSDDIIAINRGLIQKQTEGGIQQTFGGIIKTDGDLRGISISSDELGDISKRIGYDSNKLPKQEIQQKKPDKISPITPNVARQGVKIAEKSRTVGSTAYSGARTPSGRAPVATRTRVMPGPTRTSGQVTSSNQGENIQFILGNIAGSRGVVKPNPNIPSQIKPQIQDDIIAINRGLIQKQSERGIQQTFGGIIKTDGDISGISISSDEFGDISKRIGYDSSKLPKPKIQQKKPDQILTNTPNVARQGVRIAEKSRTVGSSVYSGSRTPSGRVSSSTGTQIKADQLRETGQAISSTQGENIQFTIGNRENFRGAVRPGPQSVSAPNPRVQIEAKPQLQLGDDIIAINRGLIQKQSEAGFEQTFSGVIQTDGNLEGVSISSEKLGDLSKRIGYDSNKLSEPKVQQKKPDQVKPISPNVARRQRVRITEKSRTVGSTAYSGARISAGRAPVATRTRVLTGTARISGQGISSNQGGNMQFVLGNIAGSADIVKPGPQAVFKTKPKTSAEIRPQTQLSDDIIALNRGLIQKQSESGFQQTFGGVIKSDNLQGVSVSAEELGDLSRRVGLDSSRSPNAEYKPMKPQQVLTTTLNNVAGQGIRTTDKSRTVGSAAYGGVRTSAGIAPGLTRTRVITGPARMSGQVQGENIQSVLGKVEKSRAVVRPGPQAVSAPKPIFQTDAKPQIQFSDDIIELNRGLIRKQSEAGFEQTFSGVIQTDGNLEGLPISTENLQDLSKRVGYDSSKLPISEVQQKTPGQVIKLTPNVGRQGVRITEKPTAVRGNAYTGLRTSTVRVTGVRGAPAIARPAGIPGGAISANQDQNIRFILGNTAGSSGSARSRPQAIPSTRPKIQTEDEPKSQVSDDIIALNRDLIRKQNEEGFQKAFGGVIQTGGNPQDVSISSKELGDLSKRIVYDSNKVQVPLRQFQKPDRVLTLSQNTARQGTRVAEKSSTANNRMFTSVRTSSRGVTGYTTRRVIPVSGTGNSAIQDDNIKFVLGSTEGSSGPNKPITLTATGDKTKVRNLAGFRGAVRPGPQGVLGLQPITPSEVKPNIDVGDDIIALNRGLIQKQREAGVLQTFSGLAKTDGDLAGKLLSTEELRDLSKLLGSAARDSSLGTYQTASSSRGSNMNVRVPQISRGRVTSLGRSPSSSIVTSELQQQLSQERFETPISQETFDANEPTSFAVQDIRPEIFQNTFQQQSEINPGFGLVDASPSQTVQSSFSDDVSSQSQIKLDDILDQSSQPITSQKVLGDPSVQSKISLGDIQEKYSQEKLPIEIPGYVPPPSFMSPFNYRVPGLSSIKIPTVPEQQKLEQVFV